ncbi:MAG: S41 family peptidase [Sulfuritalea sp.]|nr:S41 family peptidase [Sulfuritalea sp.]
MQTDRRGGFRWLRLLPLLVLLLATGTTPAAEIRNVAAYQQADRLIVSYDLEDGNPVDAKECASALRPELCRQALGSQVAALFAINGRLYSHESLRLEGDVGRKVEPGKGRRFAWPVLQDFPQGITTEILVNVAISPKRLREKDVVSLGDQQTEIFRRIDTERIAVAEANRSLVFGTAAKRLANKIDDTVKASYATEPDEALLEKSRYYCARFFDGNVATEQLAASWEKSKTGPPPQVTDESHAKYFSCLLRSLDPHSDYLTPEAFRELKVETKGEFGGLGMELTMKNGVPAVVSPIEDTPAFRAGILTGDQILEIDGKSTRGMTLIDAVRLLRGQKGTRITLTLQREGNALPLRVELVRDVIVVRSVRSRLLDDGYGYIRIAQFQERTADDVGAALESLKAGNGGTLKGLVLDLRNDPGGLLSSAVSVASRFIESGLIVSMQGRERSSNHQYPAQRITKEAAYPIVVLINGGSASAAEIVAGALQDHRRAVIVGARSFGKGSVQTILPIEQGAIKLTTAIYYTPNGRSLQQVGIEPDIPLDQDATLDEGSIAFAQRLLRESSGTRNLVVLKDRLEQLKIEEFHALYKNAVRASVAVGVPSAATSLAAARPAPRPAATSATHDRADEHRVALVIGNSAYPSAALKNPVNDARAISAKFRALGFDVITRENVRQKDMTRAITQFGEKLARSGTVGIFFYAGHGMQVRGKNYLIPVDAQISSEASVRSEAVDVDSLLEQLATSALGIVILDACRNNPFERKFRGSAGGLAQMDAPKGILIAYATAPGKVASDGDGRNGLYTQEFLRMLDEPGLKVEDVFKRVRRRVADATADQQVPWESSSLTGDFYFVGNPLAAAESRTPEAELLFWQSIRESRDAEDFNAYLRKYPVGQFSDIARNRLKTLSAGKRR